MRKKPFIFIGVCVLPSFLLALLVIILPTIQVFYLSLTNASSLGFRKPEYVGLANYKAMLLNEQFLMALANTAKLLFVAPLITITFALILAYIITQSKLKERSVYRTILFFPSVISITVVGIVWSFVFHPTKGLLNKLLAGLGFTSFAEEGYAWLSNPKTAIWAIVAVFVWQSVGYFMVMHIAAIDAIPNEVFEAATIDGAGAVRILWDITLPLIIDIVGITMVFALSGILDSSFSFSRVMTPNSQAGDVLLTYAYKLGYELPQYGYAMGVTTITLLIAFALAMTCRGFLRR
jgi:N-acetylglucosamine transport system permease protein